MKVLQRKKYILSVIADKDHVFNKPKLMNSNVFSSDQKATCTFHFDGHMVQWESDVDYNLDDEDYIKIFNEYQVRRPKES